MPEAKPAPRLLLGDPGQQDLLAVPVGVGDFPSLRIRG